MIKLRAKVRTELVGIKMKLENKLTRTQLHWRGDNEISLIKNLFNDIDPSQVRIFWPKKYGWAMTQKWMVQLLHEFQKSFEVHFKDIPYYDQAAVIEIEFDGNSYPITIDRFDKTYINEEAAQKTFLYFKMQYDRDGYDFENVIPGGFVPANLQIYLHLDELRKLRDQQDFLYDAYGRFGGQFAKSVRGQAVRILSSQNQFSYQGGIGRVSYVESLREAARSKVCVDLPGNGPLCFRLIDYMAVGSCIVAYPHHAQLPVPLTDRVNIVYCKEDMSDLNELCAYYASHDEEREAIAQNNRAYFDQHLRKEQLAIYYINSILERIQASSSEP